MATDISYYAFFGLNIVFLISVYLEISYSYKLEKNIVQGSKDGKIITRISRTFQILFFTSLVSAVLLFISKMAFTVGFGSGAKSTFVLKAGSWAFIFQTLSLLLSFILLFLLLFGLMYYRYKVEYRHFFIRRLLYISSIVAVADMAIFVMDYFTRLSVFVLPNINYFNGTGNERSLQVSPLIWTGFLAITLVYILVHLFYARGGLKKMNWYSVIAFLYFLSCQVLIIMQLTTYYASLTGSNIYKVYGAEYWYAGLFWLYINAVFIMSLLFADISIRSSTHFLGRQFSISYSMIFLRFNLLSGLALWAVSITPLLLEQYFKYFSLSI